jgi:hypothetical protein
MNDIINEFHGFFTDGTFSRNEQIKYWALFASAYMEKLFSRIDDIDELKRVYLEKTNTIVNDTARMALYYFYKYREKQLVEKLMESHDRQDSPGFTIKLSDSQIKYYEKAITDRYALSVLAETIEHIKTSCLW